MLFNLCQDQTFLTYFWQPSGYLNAYWRSSCLPILTHLVVRVKHAAGGDEQGALRDDADGDDPDDWGLSETKR